MSNTPPPIDRREIEGTAERAADRGRAEGFEAFDSQDDNLGMPDVVDSLVRGFLALVMQQRIKAHAEELTVEALQKAIVEASKRMADTFMGYTSDYAKSAWNTPEHLGAYIAANYEGAGSPDEAAEAFFLRLAADMMLIAKEHEEERIDDEVAQFQVDALVEQACQTLLGLPDLEDPESE